MKPQLNQEQSRAVYRRDQDVCVAAGPGSGKTYVLIQRYLWLLEQNVDPAAIVVITFTDKAARELRARLRSELKPEQQQHLQTARIGTVHSFCRRVLSENALAAGLDPGFGLLEANEAKLLSLEAARAVLAAFHREGPADFALLMDAWSAKNADAELADIANQCRHRPLQAAHVFAASPDNHAACAGLAEEILQEARAGRPTDSTKKIIAVLSGWLQEWSLLSLDPHAFLRPAPKIAKTGLNARPALKELIRALDALYEKGALQALRTFHLPALQHLQELVQRCAAEYTARKRAEGRLDFDDLELETLRLLQTQPSTRDLLCGGIEYILMDEVQDHSPIQWAIVNELRSPGAVFAVGDLRQSIYSFRGARPELFMAYRDEVAAIGEVDYLRTNRRSVPPLLSFVERVFEGRSQLVETVQFESFRGAEDGEDVVGVHEFETAEEEIAWMADAIVTEQQRSSRAWSDFAILLRKKKLAEPIAEVFRKRGIPFTAEASSDLFSLPVIMDARNWLRVLHYADDAIALVGMLRSPFFAVSDEDLLELRLQAGNKASLAVAAAASETTQPMWRVLEAQRRASNLRPASTLLQEAFDRSGYAGQLSPADDAALLRLFALLDERERRSGGGLSDLLRYLDELENAGTEQAPPAAVQGDAVAIMTFHASKGLEFPVVFCPALNRPSRGDAASLTLSEQGDLGVRWRHPFRPLHHQTDEVHHAVGEANKVREAEESLRLLFVAMTRAEDRLYLSWHQQSKGNKQWIDLLKPMVQPAPASKSASSFTDMPSIGFRTTLPLPARQEPELSSAAISDIVCWAAGVSAPVQATTQEEVVTRSGEDELPPPSPEQTMPRRELGIAVHRLLAGEAFDAPADAQRLAARFRASELGQQEAQAQRVEREFDFVVAVDDLVLRGQIDLWLQLEGKEILVDYKTDLIAPAEVEVRAGIYALQLQLYALCLQAAGHKVSEAWLCFLEPQRNVRVPLDEAALNEARQTLLDYRRAMTTPEQSIV
jgi:ATP-dependent helicase/nuclease subunit A